MIPNSPSIPLCLPSLNEAENIQAMLGQILDLDLVSNADIADIDDGYSGGTDSLVEEMAVGPILVLIASAAAVVM